MSLLIGEHIRKTLQAEEVVTGMVGDRIYPVVVPAGVPQYPFITFVNIGAAPDETKDGTCSDNVSSGIVVVAKKYDEAVSIGHHVRYAIEGKTGSYKEFEVEESVMQSWQEDYVDDISAYVVTLSFNFKTIDY